jgi:branched-chain amino acid aminotransferase
MMISYVNGQFLPEDQATLQVGDLSIQRGYAIFDYFRTVDNIPLFLDDYIDRFFGSAALMRLEPLPLKSELRAIIYSLIQKNKLGESGIKIILTGGYSPESYEPVSPNLVLLQQPLVTPSADRFRQGIKVISHEYRRELSSVKSINYLMGVWLQDKVRAADAQDVLYYRDGEVSEFPRANVFMVAKDGKVITPSDHILGGITRKKLLEIAALKFEVEVRPVHIEEIKTAAEVFMTSTTKRLLPVTRIDETVIGHGRAGDITTQLLADFLQLEESYLRARKVPVEF